MNTILLLLVFCFAFFALKQKSEKTRNILLVVLTLLCFCMFSVEGVSTTSLSGVWYPGSDFALTKKFSKIWAEPANAADPASPSSSVQYDKDAAIASWFNGALCIESDLCPGNAQYEPVPDTPVTDPPTPLWRSQDLVDPLKGGRCLPGKQWGKGCESCPELYYKGQGQSSCTKCPIGYTPNLTKTGCIKTPEDCSSTTLECPGYKIKRQGQKCADATCVKSDMGSGGNCCIDPCRDSDCRIGHWLWRGGDKCGTYKACPVRSPPT